MTEATDKQTRIPLDKWTRDAANKQWTRTVGGDAGETRVEYVEDAEFAAFTKAARGPNGEDLLRGINGQKRLEAVVAARRLGPGFRFEGWHEGPVFRATA